MIREYYQTCESFNEVHIYKQHMLLRGCIISPSGLAKQLNLLILFKISDGQTAAHLPQVAWAVFVFGTYIADQGGGR